MGTIAYVKGAVQGFTTMMQSMAAAVQANASTIINLKPGSVLLAGLEAYAGVTLWTESLILQAMTAMRLSSSVGADVDSFVQDWRFSRIGSVPAVCNTVQMSRFTATNPATIPAGMGVLTGDGTQAFTVIADPAQPTWNDALNAYVIPALTSSATVTVQANVPGAAGNVPIGSITLPTTGGVFVDTITNTSPATGGIDGESDAATKARFALYIASLAKSTVPALDYSVTSLQPGIDVNLVENYTSPGPIGGTWQPGSFFMVVDDGSGSPPGTLITAAQNAVNATRAASVRYNVYAPSILTVNAIGFVTVAPGYLQATVADNVATAITALLNSRVIAQAVPFAEVVATGMGVAGVLNFFSVTLNTLTADIVPTQIQLVKAGTVSIT